MSKSDHELFNCSEEWESNYVASQYGKNKQKVRDFLRDCCKNNKIKNSTHKEVYALIKKELGLTR